jgi:hypothetical protein
MLMMRFGLICAVAAFAATALPFAAQAYCRGCVIEDTAKPAPSAMTARAEMLPEPPVASCHVEKQRLTANGRTRIRRVEICE